MRQIQAERYSKANPKLTINIDIVDTIDPPKIDFEYIDGTKVYIISLFDFYYLIKSRD